MKKYFKILFSFYFLLFAIFCSAQYNVLLDFNSSNGEYPSGGLTLSGNVLYGMTGGGGVSGDTLGNVFSIHTDGTNFKQLLIFTGSNDGYPEGDLTLSGNMLYGMTAGGGIPRSMAMSSVLIPMGITIKTCLSSMGSMAASPGGM